MAPPAWLSLAVHGLGTVDWQRSARRTGWPHTSPALSPLRSVLLVGGSAVGGVIASWAAGAVALAVAGTRTDGADRATVAALWGALVPLPVVGVGAGAAVQATLARRYTTQYTADGRTLWPDLLRAALVVIAHNAVHATVTALTDRLLDLLSDLSDPPDRPDSPPASTHLDVRGPDLDDDAAPDGFVVYLDGVGRCTGRTTPVARELAAALTERLPRWVVVLSVMPNDVLQRPAWDRPLTGPLWRALHRRSSVWMLTRGVWEAVVALDPRYRDRIAQEHTATLTAHLLAAGYRPGSGRPVVLVGLSGGAQTALRVASETARALGGAPLDVVTLGAFADGSADLGGVRRVHAVVSWGDPAELLPVLLFPSRWTVFGVSRWSRAKRARTVVVRRHDWARHIGAQSYLSPTAIAPDGRTRLAQAADVVAVAARQLREQGLRPTVPPEPGG